NAVVTSEPGTEPPATAPVTAPSTAGVAPAVPAPPAQA
ncbi:MAG: hypothetical protein JWR81_4577, partial [Pseudonocardia sp.]|nr:hypothetical protein [Pseudonocardia sp.]